MSTSQDEMAFLQNTGATLLKKTSELSDIARPNIFWGNIAYNILMTFVFNQMYGRAIPHTGIPIADFVLSAFNLISGIHQLSAETSYRPNAQRLKGLVTVLDAVKTTSIGATSLAMGLSTLFPPSLAASTAILFGLSLDDLRQAKLRCDPYYWIKDTLSQLKDNANRLKKLDQTIQQTSSEPHNVARINRLSNQYYTIQETQDKLNKDMQIQIKALLLANPNNATAIQKLIQVYETPQETPEWLQPFHIPTIQAHVLLLSESEKKEIKAQQTALKIENEKALKDAMENTTIYGLALVGTILLCIPGLQIPGIAILAFAAAAFTAKNLSSVVKTIGKTETHNQMKSQQSIVHPQELKEASPYKKVEPQEPPEKEKDEDDGGENSEHFGR
ncbi:MAG: hypothetical protein NTU48_05355 [Legionellales bacterium]|nr:hypothetical protein [Legionellales bacterium]